MFCRFLSVWTLVNVSHAAPNIIFMVADDLGWADISLNGSPQVSTPNIDAIGREGIRLTKYYTPSVCSPTRACILSGRHVIHTGLYMPINAGNNVRLGLDYTLLPEYLKKKIGEETFCIGKWHLGMNEKVSK